MNGVIVAEPIVISDENSHLLSITSTGSAKVVLTSSGVVQTTITNTPNVNVTNTPSVIVTSSGIISAKQSGTWNITNITGTISLPTGAATSTGQATTNSKLDTLNTTVGNSQGTVSPGTAATKSTLIGGQYNSTLPTLTTAQQAALQVDSRGRIILSSTGATSVNQGTAAATAGAWPVKITDGTTVVGVSTNAEERVSDTVNHGGVNGAITVGTTAVEAKVGASKLTNRKLLTIFHNSGGKLYWGYSNAVTSSNGTQLFRNTMVSMPVGDGTSVWLISDTAGQDVRITEGA